MASQRVLGRVATGAGDAEELKGMWVEVSRATASNSTTIDFTGIDSSADEWMVEIYNCVPSTDGQYLTFKTSANGGSTYDDAGTDYGQHVLRAGTTLDYDPVDYLYVSGNWGIGSATNETGLNSSVTLFRPSAAEYTQMRIITSGIGDDGSELFFEAGAAVRKSAAAVDAVRFLFDSGNIASGTFVLLKRLK
jgi:hypothetical protein